MVRVSRFYRSVPGFRRAKRAWRSRGFGIHSPFAFRFITCVLRQRGRYYAYGELRDIAGGKVCFRRAALVFRLVCEFAPETVVVTTDVPDVISEAVRLADSRARIVTCGADGKVLAGVMPSMLICGYSSTNVASVQSGKNYVDGLIDAVFSNGGVVVALDVDRKNYVSLTRRMKCGMSFTNRHTAIFFSRYDLPRQDFEINF